MQEVNGRYPVLFGGSRPGAAETGTAEGGAAAEDVEDETGFAAKWGWVAWVDAVSETCRCSWEEVWRMEVMEFLNIVCYARDKAEERKRSIERWKRRH